MHLVGKALMTTAHDDYDSPWKDALEGYFDEFMAFFFTFAYNDIDWESPIEFLVSHRCGEVAGK